jgi:hypothetical protein
MSALPEIREARGVHKTEGDTQDFYRGTMRALVSAGFPQHLFPGQPGQLLYTAMHGRPSEPGALAIFRDLSGPPLFTIELTVSMEVRGRRVLQRARRDRAFQSILGRLGECAR